MHRAVKSVAGISFDIEHFHDLNSGIILKNIFVASEPLLQIGLLGHRVEDDVSLAVQLLCESLAAKNTSLHVVGADEVEPFALGSIGIDGKNRYSGIHSFINGRPHQTPIRD